jgi:hypothetical protein
MVTDPVTRATATLDPIIKGVAQYAAKAAGAFATMYMNEAIGQAINKLVYEVSKKNLKFKLKKTIKQINHIFWARK